MSEITDPETSAMFNLVGGSEPIPGKTLLADGWVYRDLKKRFSHEMWNLFLETLGEGNYYILAMTKAPDYARGQLLISPQGVANMLAFKVSP